MQQTVKYTSPIMKFIDINISQFHGIPWNSMELARTFPGQKGSSIEFHGTLKVPWNLMPAPNSMEFHGIATHRTKVPWNLVS